MWKVNYSDQVRAPFSSIPIQDVMPLYKGLARFNHYAYDPANMITLKLNPGKTIDKGGLIGANLNEIN